MFTGIVKEVGKVEKIEKRYGLWKIGIASREIYKSTSVSDSISLNGVCLTLIDKRNNLLFFEAVKPTLESTNLKRIRIGSLVNLEDSLKAGEKLGGHFVLGHIDCESQIRSIKRYKDFSIFEIKFPPKFKKFLVEKGSIAVEGISLTIKEVRSSSFTVDIIPYTLENTNLKYKRVGDWVNLEFDYLLKSINPQMQDV
jgi:riboflavin synthase